MGTAQLLYITLGVIIIGLAIVTGLQMFQAYSQDSAREQLISHSLTILSKAEEYYKKPTNLGGGGGSYTGFQLPSEFTRNELGNFNVSLVANNQRVNIDAKGDLNGYDGNNPVRIIARISKNNKNRYGEMQILVRN